MRNKNIFRNIPRRQAALSSPRDTPRAQTNRYDTEPKNTTQENERRAKQQAKTRYVLRMTPSVIQLGDCSICGEQGYGVHQPPGMAPTFFCEHHTRERWNQEE